MALSLKQETAMNMAIAGTSLFITGPGGVGKSYQMILCGDFFQLPPVSRSKETKFAFETEAWVKLNPTIIKLIEPFRQKDNAFFWALNRIREGKMTEEDINLLKTRMNADLSIWLPILPTGLYSTNRDVDRINNEHLHNLPGETLEFTMTSSFQSNGVSVNQFAISTTTAALIKGCQAPEKLLLKKGAQVMLLKNLDLENGLCNGSRGVVHGFSAGAILVKFRDIKEHVEVFQHTWTSKIECGKVSVTQFPLKLAWVMTIHKAQGTTLDLVKISLDRSVFAPGQAYVALSRVRDLKGLSITSMDHTVIRTNKKVKEWYDAIQ